MKYIVIRTFPLLSLCNGLWYAYAYVYVLASTFSLNLLIVLKTTTPTKFIVCTYVAWVNAYEFCAQPLHQLCNYLAAQFPKSLVFVNLMILHLLFSVISKIAENYTKITFKSEIVRTYTLYFYNFNNFGPLTGLFGTFMYNHNDQKRQRPIVCHIYPFSKLVFHKLCTSKCSK
jgi:hypothetical protein